MPARVTCHRGFGPGVPQRAAAWPAMVAALLFVVCAPMQGRADEAEDAAACEQAVAQAVSLVAALPAEDPSRRFAEADLRTALTEMASGEVDECPELVARAKETIETRPYRLRAGERMDGYGPDRPH